MEVAPRYAQCSAALNDIYVPARGATTSTTTATSRALGGPTSHDRNGGVTRRCRPRPNHRRGGEHMRAALDGPVSAFAHFADALHPLSINHQRASLATTISFNLAATASR